MNVDVSVREVMDREYVGVSESDDLIETVELLLRQDAETAVVQRGSEHVGVLTYEDILATLVDGPPPEQATVGDAMRERVPTVEPETRLDAAADIMSTQESGRLVVTNGSEALGVISERDLLASRTRELEQHPQQHEEDELLVDASGGVETGDTGRMVDGYREQGICEGCGRFTSELSGFNGQLLCADCRTM